MTPELEVEAGGVEDRMTPAEIVRELVVLKAEAGRAGLWRTMRALDEALFQVGWELAEREAARASLRTGNG